MSKKPGAMDKKSACEGNVNSWKASLLKIFNLPRINRQLLRLND